MLARREPVLVLPTLSMEFNPDLWNGPDIFTATNCLSHAFNDPRTGNAFWTKLARKTAGGFIFPEEHIKRQYDGEYFISHRESAARICMIFSGLERIQPHAYTPDRRHIIAYSHRIGHFFRLNSNNIWSHKQGAMLATVLDNAENVLTDSESEYYALPAEGVYIQPV